MSDSLRPHGLQHARPPCPSPTPGVYSNSHPLSQWCHPTISSFVALFSSCPPSFPASGSFQMSQLFMSGGQSIGASASVLPKNIRGWFPLRLIGLPCSSNGKESACHAGDQGSIPGLGSSSGEGNGNPLQYSCLENSMDREAWWATVRGVAKSRTRLSD